jgi:hypothetical protein
LLFRYFLYRLLRDPLLTLIPRDLLQKLIQDAGSEPKHGIDAPIDEPLAEHLPYPHHLPFDFLAFFTPLLLPLKPFSQLLQVFLPLVCAPVLSDVLLTAI